MPNPKLRLACVASKLTNWAVTAKQAENVAWDAMQKMLMLKANRLDPKSLCEDFVTP